MPNANEARSTSYRATGVLHRNAVTSADKLATPGSLTVTDAGAGGNLANSQQNVAVSAYNRWGNTVVSTGNVTPTASHRVRVAFAAVTGADGYDLFLGTAANPPWVGRITEAQRAAGGTMDAVATYSASGGAAGSLDIGVAGSGLAANVNPFAANNAYRPDNVTPVDCTGYKTARLLCKLAVTDLRSLPTCVLSIWGKNGLSSGDYHWIQNTTLSILTAVAQPLGQEISLTVDGTTGLAVLVESISGQGAALSVWVELA